MDLISKNDVYEAVRPFRWLGSRLFVDLIFKALRIDEINKIYSAVEDTKDPQTALDTILSQLQVSYSVSTNDLNKLPADGKFIVMSNHPFGGIDGVIMAKVIGKQYPDFKILVNYFLCRIKPIASYFIPVNPFEKSKSSYSSTAGLRRAIEHVRNGHPLGIFPAGQVSAINDMSLRIEDTAWKAQIVRMCVNLDVPIFPIYFEGRNSLKFSLLGIINPIIRTALIPSEFVNKKGKNIVLRIGDEIKKEDLNKYTDNKDLARFLKSKSYELKHGKNH